MWFNKNKGKQQQEDEATSPASQKPSGNPTSNDTSDEKSTAVDESKPKEAKNPKGGPPPDYEYPTGLTFVLIISSVFISMFLVSLDRFIISTAIPQITNEFHSVNDIGWYATAYLLTNCSFQLVFGKLYKIFSIKTTLMTAIVLFEAGSALCGAAPSSLAFIVGRAIAGLGAGGILSGVITVITYTLPLDKRPKYQGFFGAVLGIASVTGPLVGGAFTTDVTWRWCFYLNLPIGALVFTLIFFMLKLPTRRENNAPLKEKLRQLNALGLIALLPGVICLCLALQWGGTTYSWSGGRIIALLVIAFALLITFVLVQIWKPDQATLPPRIFTQRSIASGFWASCCMGSHQAIFVYYLPIWFQAIEGVSAVHSGIRLLPMIIALVVTSIIVGQLVSRIGYYTPFMIFGVCLIAIGAGLLTTLAVDSTTGMWIGFQIVYGIGFGTASQAPNMAAQTVLQKQDVSIGASLMFFGQTLFGAVFSSVGQNLLINKLSDHLAQIPGISPQEVQRNGATDIVNLIPAKYHLTALKDYNDSLRGVFQVALIMACLAIPAALLMEWRSVKKKTPPKPTDEEKAVEENKAQNDNEAIDADSESENGSHKDGRTCQKEKDQSRNPASTMLNETTGPTGTPSQIEEAAASTPAVVGEVEEETKYGR